MARQPRFMLPNQSQHIIQRGVNRCSIFTDNEDYQLYLTKLAQACERFGCKVHSYVLMHNHVHLLLTPLARTSISRVMQSLGRNYVQYFNYKYNRTGTLLEGRYKASLLDAEQYLLTCHRYIELNPVRAGIVLHPVEYPWSSYHRNALGDHDKLISEHITYHRLGTTTTTRQAAYQSLFDEPIDEVTLKQIRDNTNNAWILGDDRFRTEIEALTKRQAAPKPRGGDRKSQKYLAQSNLNHINP